MTELRVEPAQGPLIGEIGVPSDKSISHRSLIFAALARGRSRLSGFSYGEDNVSTMSILRRLGVEIDDQGNGQLVVTGAGLRGLRAATGPLDCGNSGTSMRLLAGLLAAQPFTSTLVGDASLSGRPMLRVASPLRARGARVEGRPHPLKTGDITAPLVVGPAVGRLAPLQIGLSVASAQVKSAILLSGLFAEGETRVSEPYVSRDHTERLLLGLGVPLLREGTTVTLPEAPDQLPAFEVELAGDLSAAAFPLVAAAIVENSAVTIHNCGLNPTRTGILDVLGASGATLAIEGRRELLGEPVGSVRVSGSVLSGTLIEKDLAVRSIDEIPIACVLAARARGTTRICDVGELRVKESDRIGTMAELLRAFGVKTEESETGMVIEGCPDRPLTGGVVADSHGDHRIAMSAAILGLVADGPTRITNADCIATSYPGFSATLRALGAQLA